MNRAFSDLEAKFSTARWPESGKPLGNNDRIYRVQDDVFQTGYRWEHYSSRIFTQYRDALVLHRGALDSPSSKVRMHNAGLRVYETKNYAAFVHEEVEYIWPDCEMLVLSSKVYRVQHEPVRCPDTNIVLRMKTFYTEELPVVQARSPRPLPKSRNTILEPKAGDAFEYRGKKYIWVNRGFLKAVPYMGDNSCYPTYVHVNGKVTPSEVLINFPHDPLSEFHYLSLTNEMKAIERFPYDPTKNQRLEV